MSDDDVLPALGVLVGIWVAIFFGFFGAPPKFTEAGISEVAFSTALMLMFSFWYFLVYRRPKLPERSLSVTIGGKQHNLELHTRDELEAVAYKLLPLAKEKLILWAVSFESIHGHTNELKRILANKTDVQVLLLDPTEEEIIAKIESVQTLKGLKDNINTSLRTFSELRKSFPNFLTIKTYNSLPECSAVIIDPKNREDGLMQVGFYVYSIDANIRPGALVTPKQEVFMRIFEAYDTLWKASKEYPGSASSPMVDVAVM